MKKFGFILACCLIMSNIFAQSTLNKYDNNQTFSKHIAKIENLVLGTSNVQYVMSGYHTSDYYETDNFYYDNGGRLIATYQEVPGEYKVYDSLKYNEAEQIVRLDGWQWLNGQWKNVYYVEYTYTTGGKVASRTNYNWYNEEWTLGGIYQYDYNADNQIVLSTLFLGGEIFQTVDYTYENGFLKKELWSMSDFYGGFDPSELYTYEYTDGRVSLVTDSAYDDGWEYYGKEEFEYDNNGNCILYQRFDNSDDVVEKSIYEYDSRLLANSRVPVHPDLERPKYYTNTNLCTLENWYSLDVEHVLQYICDYVYEYTNVTSVEDHQTEDLVCYPNPASSHVIVNGVNNANISLYDMNGRIVYQGVANSDKFQINISNFSEGNYVLQANENGKTRVARITITR